MKAVLVGAVNYLFALFIRFGPIKFVVTIVLFLLLDLLLTVVFQFLPSWMKLDHVFDFLTPEMWFFLDLVNISLGAPLMISAATTRFLIRRIPLVG